MNTTGLFTSTPTNVAAWALKPKERPLTVSSAPYLKPPKGHVVIKVYDVAVNPIDWILQDDDIFHAKYPTVFGSDAAGEIAEVADDVKDFQIGTRVIAHCSRAKDVDLPSGATGAFQKYVVVQASAVAELPYTIPSSTGVVLPLGISTASAGLYQKDFLNLPYPVSDGNPKSLGRTILIWGGSSSVGSCAIQLAVASGVEVVTTCSERNFDYVEELGAAAAFDYRKKDVEDEVVKWLDGKTVVGAYHAVGEGGAQAAARIVDRAKGKAIVVTVRGVPEEGVPGSVRMKAVGAGAIFENDVGPTIWRDFLPKALKNGTIVPKPGPKIVGENLRSVQLGLDTQKKGVSAEKVVVSYIN
ncbi:hypothetical protein DOTSEDRAFT_179479 [Dothistroma septosporum NZE10]|uniref:Enoyl reductase (ER) domain-containing protein n=1 Tax=Dothistroma septosporum (strain NZE10 / CBS 128990) TaxID=675120 RepID=N1PGE0_DOTSN|nr:hypothetical protein DOTSEDRAFT_179479 [Dothistroma septosporum NZE10]